MLKKVTPYIVALITFLGFPVLAFADGHFTASNVHYNQATSEVTFDGTGFSPSATWYDSVGISSCNDSSSCANNGGEYWGPSTYFSNYQQHTLSDPQHFDVTFAFNSYRPSTETVYLWVKTDGDGRTYSQALDLNTISGYSPFTASNVQYNPSTNELSFTGTGFAPSASNYDSIGISSCNNGHRTDCCVQMGDVTHRSEEQYE